MAFGGYGLGPGQFQAMTGVAFDAKNNRIFTVEQVYSRIQMFRYYTDAEAKAEIEKRKLGDGTKAPAVASATSTATPTAAAPAATATPAPTTATAAPTVAAAPVASAGPAATDAAAEAEKDTPSNRATGAFSIIPSAAGQTVPKP